MHPRKEASALHPEDRDEDVGDKDEEDENSDDSIQAVQTLLVGFFGDIPPSCKRAHARTQQITRKTQTNKKMHKNIFLWFSKYIFDWK